MEAEQIKTILTEKLKNIPNIELKFKEQLDIFRSSESVVVCEDCGTIFYAGPTKAVAEEKRYVDWKMLSFRHVWGLKHKVVIFMPYFGLSIFPLSNFAELFDPQDNTKIRYWLEVERFRQRLIGRGDKRATRTNDENWDANSICYCSTCGKVYHDPKDACYCCFETKPWLPQSEVISINIKEDA